ncbi:MAG: class I SAM-dependent methyltransferase [Cyanobacteria bacterium SZAS LIN-3]|nr:class I SAM-dependent methyltransferase [Cyanobacteria bacterium SZAS LIN-3]
MEPYSTIKHYSERVEELAATYESVTFEQVHGQVLDLIPPAGSSVLDVGAGSGRDAAWFSRMGCEVTAVEPAGKMLEKARQLHPTPQINWLPDKLPGLEATINLGQSFDLILLSAVWMHIPARDRPRAFRKLVSLLRAGGKIIISLRHGSFDDARYVEPVSVDELEKLARQHGLAVLRICRSQDRLQRSEVNWETVCLQLPDDGTEGLPLLRHIILNDSKSSTYKLALLRILVRIADSAIGMAKPTADDGVTIPLGLVALYWIRTYKTLVEADIPQMPANISGKGLSFVREPFLNLRHLSPYDLRVGAAFTGQDAAWLRQALLDARNTIHKMPAFYITYPNSSVPVFKTTLCSRPASASSFVLNEQFLASFGEMYVPGPIWMAMSRFASWIEPSLLSEWIRLMQQYCEVRGREVGYDSLMQALVWLDPERDTTLVRSITQKLIAAETPIFCVWSGKRLKMSSLDVDHCFPFSAWPCSDLWNLMPTDCVVNQRSKGNKLVTAKTLSEARDRMLSWWHTAYIDNKDIGLGGRFASEAVAALPLGEFNDALVLPAHIFEGIGIKRAALKRNLQLPDWEI